MKERLRIILLGSVGRLPFAGMAWEAIQYLEGFRRLGHDVYYIEDTNEWPYYPGKVSTAAACRYAAAYIQQIMSWSGMPDRWAYRAAAQKGRIYGLSDSQFARVFKHADVLINLAGCTTLHDEHFGVPVRVYLQTDPGTGEILVARDDPDSLAMLRAHTHFFTFAENLGAPDYGLPPQPVEYHPTRNPIVPEWFNAPARPIGDGNGRPRVALRFTTVGNWNQSGDGYDIEWKGELYTWSKHLEFLKFIDLPRRIGQPIELALASIATKEIRLLKSHGWLVVDAYPLSKEILPYREYIFGSDGEFTVAKDQNVRLRTGWFSDRSASYLAAGKPVITQDTAFGNLLPTGEGLFAFNTMEEIIAAFDAIKADYKKHSRAARAIVEEYFRAEKVLSKLIDQLGGDRPHGN